VHKNVMLIVHPKMAIMEVQPHISLIRHIGNCEFLFGGDIVQSIFVHNFLCKTNILLCTFKISTKPTIL
jgi:hypothetical protein